MIDPPDYAAWQQQVYGDQSINPTPTDGGLDHDGLPQAVQLHRPIRLFENFSQIVAAGATAKIRPDVAAPTVTADHHGAYWHVSLVPAVNTAASVYQQYDPSGPPLAYLGSGGQAKFPVRGNWDLSLTNTGSAPVSVTIWLVCGFEFAEVLGGSS